MLMLDHLVLAVPNLFDAIQYFQENLGISPLLGGKHIGKGTHNAILGIGNPEKKMYLELLAIDPEDQKTYSSYPLGLSQGITKPYIASWCVRCETEDDISITNAKMNILGSKYRHGEIRRMQRQTTSGDILSWHIANSSEQVIESLGQVPFLICWNDLHFHPTKNLANESFLDFSIEFYGPDAISLEKNLQDLRLEKLQNINFKDKDISGINLTLRKSKNTATFHGICAKQTQQPS